MLETLSFEALAHYARGMTTTFFIVWTYKIYKQRHQNSMMMVMTIAASYITFGFAKDIVFLYTPWMKHPIVEGMVTLIDILCTPFVTAFFLETTKPGIITPKRLLAGVILFLLPIAAFIIIPDPIIIQIAFAMSFLFSATGFIFIIYFVACYDKCIAENYPPHTQHISVKWVAGCAIAYFAWLATYYICFNNTTWASEVSFDVFSIIIWIVMWRFSCRHHVIIEMLEKRQTPPAVSPKPATEKKKTPIKDTFITQALAKKMEEKIYLNPKLTLNDLAQAIGTNRSYLSEYLNSQGKSYNDYINEFRVAEACRILDAAKPGERVNMTDVASRSGFNSISSFNRYFCKIKELPPSAYLRLRLMESIL